MIPPHPPGALRYAPLHFSRERVCRQCGQVFTTTGNAQSCAVCRGTPEHKRWIRRNRARWDRKYEGRGND